MVTEGREGQWTISYSGPALYKESTERGPKEQLIIISPSDENYLVTGEQTQLKQSPRQEAQIQHVSSNLLLPRRKQK